VEQSTRVPSALTPAELAGGGARLGALRWRDTAPDREAFLEYVERLAAEDDASGRGGTVQETLRSSLRSALERGWYFGTEAFREHLLERARAVIGQGGRGRQNYHGAEVHEHGEAEARKNIAQRLCAAGLGVLDLATLPKSDVRKVQIAKEIRARTCVRLGFVARELGMGTAMNVSKLTNAR
jgi:putative transposase